MTQGVQLKRMNVLIARTSLVAVLTAIAILMMPVTSANSTGGNASDRVQKSEKRADGCGSGYHKQTNGKLSGTATKKAAHGRVVKSSISGYVRFCTRGRNWGRPDQFNQRVRVGIPETVYSRSWWSGGTFKQKCAKQVITVTAGRISDGHSLTIGGGGPSAAVSYGDKSVTLTRRMCDRTLRSHAFSSNTLTVTAPNGTCYPGGPGTVQHTQCLMGPVIKSIQIVTTTEGYFKVGGRGYSPAATQIEVDYSNR